MLCLQFSEKDTQRSVHVFKTYKKILAKDILFELSRRGGKQRKVKYKNLFIIFSHKLHFPFT